MIGSLRGKLLDRASSGEVLIEVAGGVGYRVVMGATAAVRVGEPHAEVFVWVHHHIREDTQTLYGFIDREERRCFEALLGAHGVGPSLALAILSVHDPVALRQVLASDDIAALCLVPGVGKKTAARLLVELKSRLDAGDLDAASVLAAAGDATAPLGEPSLLADVRAALVGLGYESDEITAAMKAVDPTPDDDVQSVLRRALRQLAVAR